MTDRDDALDSIVRNLKFTASLNSRYSRSQSPMAVMRRKCIDCCGGQLAEIEHCPIKQCALWPYRMGSNPLTNRRGGSRVQPGQNSGTPPSRPEG